MFTIYVQVILTQHMCVHKNDTDVAHYNYDTHEGILIIFSRYVTKKISNWKLLYFSTSPNWYFYIS